MAIEVTTVDGDITSFDSATGYHIDEHGFLHIRSARTEGNDASFHANRWQGVSKS